jgi:hypothetical protein
MACCVSGRLALLPRSQRPAAFLQQSITKPPFCVIYALFAAAGLKHHQLGQALL